MAITRDTIEHAKTVAEGYQQRLNSLAESPGMTPDNPEYIKASDRSRSMNASIAEYYASQRQTDDGGKLTAPPDTRQPAVVEGHDGGEASFHYEPSVAEVQKILRERPDLVNKLDLGEWAGTGGSPETAEPVADVGSGMPMGQTVNPERSYIDNVTKDSTAYDKVAEYLWQQRSEQAAQHGETVKRYRDIHLKDHPVDFLTGGVGYNVERRLAPGALGAADSMSGGMASPLYDTARDFTEFQQGHRQLQPEHTEQVADPMSGAPQGENVVPQEQAPELWPSSEDVYNRSPLSYMAGNFGGYALGGNPSNLAAEGAIKGLAPVAERMLGGEAGGMLGKTAVSAAVGGGINAAESGSAELGRSLHEGAEAGEVARRVGGAAAMGGVVGGLGGGMFGVVGEGVGAARDLFRSREGIKVPLKTFEDAGGQTGGLIRGVTPTPEMAQFERQATQPGNVGSAQALAAEQVAPHIQESFESQSRDQRQSIEQQKQEYFRHPAYNTQEVSAQPAIQALTDMAGQGWVKGPVTGGPMNVNEGQITRLGNVIREYSQPLIVSRAEAGAAAAEHGGVVLDPELGNRLFGFSDENAAPPGSYVIAVPVKLNAEKLTALEERIDDELKMASTKGSNEDPVWTRLNQSVKEMRDQFPYYIDDSGKLIPPPLHTDTPQPYGHSEDVPPPNTDEMRVLPKPVSIEGNQARGEALQGIGQGQPEIPNPFDPRKGASQLERIEPRAPVEVRGDGSGRRPEGLLGVGPGQPEIPNPFDPRLPTSKEALQPNGAIDVQGSYNEPEYIPGDPQGIGPRRDQPQNGLKPQRTEDVRGDYNQPDIIEPDAQPPNTERMHGAPEQPIEEATPLSLLAGNKLAMPDETPREPTERMERPGHEYKDESLPGPMAKDWADTEEQSGDYFEGTVAPGRETRRIESQAMEDLGKRQEAMDAAIGEINNIDRRLGPLPEADKERMLLDIMSKKLGFKVTREHLAKLGILAGGAAVAATSDDEDTEGAGLGAMALVGGHGKGGKRPKGKQLEELLDDGTKVEGFSALRRKQHLAANSLETNKKRVGATGDKTIRDRVMGFNQGNDKIYDDALLEEAKRIGKEKELRTAAGSNVYGHLKNEAGFGSGKGVFNSLVNGIGLRADKPAEYLAGVPRNPFAREPHTVLGKIQRTMLEDPARRLANLTGGRPGYRLDPVNEKVVDAIHRALFGEDDKDKKKSHAKP